MSSDASNSEQFKKKKGRGRPPKVPLSSVQNEASQTVTNTISPVKIAPFPETGNPGLLENRDIDISFFLMDLLGMFHIYCIDYFQLTLFVSVCLLLSFLQRHQRFCKVSIHYIFYNFIIFKGLKPLFK